MYTHSHLREKGMNRDTAQEMINTSPPYLQIRGPQRTTPLNRFGEVARLKVSQQPIEAQSLDQSVEEVADHHSPRYVLETQNEEVIDEIPQLQ